MRPMNQRGRAVEIQWGGVTRAETISEEWCERRNEMARAAGSVGSVR